MFAAGIVLGGYFAFVCHILLDNERHCLFLRNHLVTCFSIRSNPTTAYWPDPDSGRLASDAALREYCDKNYHQLLPIISEKMHHEKVQQDKLKAVKARLHFGDCSKRNLRTHDESQYSESKMPTT
ncbi:hypothetical protein Tco_1120927 [Tanacetum coccineum]|uniref:Uncharacterized protein n=1 Tax=Tanacetum coccineum TaxID=301880 RepID=A0ABQ5IW86_9ASTR